MSLNQPKFLPTTKHEASKFGWNSLDIILITGDSYIDSPYNGVAIIGRVLVDAGYRVGIIAQPLMDTEKDIKRLGEPNLFWGVSGGSVDSMVANYTASGKRRRTDDYTPGGINNRRPDRAVISYANLIRKYCKDSAPIVLGGIEASLRRLSHYDFWSNKIRRSILFDARADYLVYGMGEKAVVELANCLKKRESSEDIKGLCFISKKRPDNSLILPSYLEVTKDSNKFVKMFKAFYANNDPITGRVMCQQQDTRYLVHNPPQAYLTGKDLDIVYELPFSRDIHPAYIDQGKIRAMDTIKFSITTHRGCYGECNFCAITVHQGRTVRSRSQLSIVNEARNFVKMPGFKGVIADIGGPTANMYGIECEIQLQHGSCLQRRCLFPSICKKLNVDHRPQIKLLKEVRKISGIKHVFVGSGVRYDLILSDNKFGRDYLKEIMSCHISGQMKIAPEHINNDITLLMGKCSKKHLLRFVNMFKSLKVDLCKNLFLTYYLMAGHPGCTKQNMEEMKKFFRAELNHNPEQVQIFTPTPSTYSTLMYYTKKNPFTGNSLFVEKEMSRKEQQKRSICF